MRQWYIGSITSKWQALTTWSNLTTAWSLCKDPQNTAWISYNFLALKTKDMQPWQSICLGSHKCLQPSTEMQTSLMLTLVLMLSISNPSMMLNPSNLQWTFTLCNSKMEAMSFGNSLKVSLFSMTGLAVYIPFFSNCQHSTSQGADKRFCAAECQATRCRMGACWSLCCM